MKKQIDQLINKHTEGYQKYILKLSVSDFKALQRLMASEYQMKDYSGLNGMWKHDVTGQITYGTVRFDNFELNVIKDESQMGGKEPSLHEAKDNVVSDIFWNSKKL